MRTVFHAGAVAAVLALAMLLTVGGCVNSVRASRTDQQTVEHVRATPITVNSRNGRVQVIGDPSLSEIEIEATIYAGGRTMNDANDRLSRTRLEVVRDTTGTLRIMPVYPTPYRSRDGANLTVRIPDAASIEIVTSNGRIIATGLSAPLTATTSNGRITVREWIGDAALTTSNSRVTVADLTGELTVRTSNGRVQIDDQAGPVDAKTSNGRIVLKLLPDESGPIDLQTSNGSITATVGPAFTGSMSMRTSNSSINIDDAVSAVAARDVERRRAELSFSEDGPASRLRTSNGRITLRTRE